MGDLHSSDVTTCGQCGAPGGEDACFCFRCGASLEAGGGAGRDPLVGRTLDSGYLLQDLIGIGGMGRVYRAEQVALGRAVAVKVVHPHLLADSRSVQRFYQEARAASAINHPNSVGIIDFGHTEDGILYLVMEYIEGRDLADLLAEHGALPAERAASISMSVLDALSEAHALGVVHRDLKPENVILRSHRSGRDIVKVVDFGLATIVEGRESSGITQPGSVCGTPDYMAPEQAQGRHVDARADLYAVGVMLFELLTGKLPYEDASATAVVLRHLHDPVPDPRQVAPEREIPEPLASIVVKAMAKDPADRFQSADAMRRALAEALAQMTMERTSGAFLTCVRCGAHNPDSLRYCGACGARLVSIAPPSWGRTSSSSLPQQAPFVGFEQELDTLDAAWREGGEAEPGRIVVLRGDPGWGRTRLVQQFVDRVASEGAAVFRAEPYRSEARVAGAALVPLLSAMLDLEGGGADMASIVSGSGGLSDAARAGIQALLSPKGLGDAVPRSRAHAVAAALEEAAFRAAERSASGRVLLVFDDIDVYDELSRSGVSVWLREGRRVPGLVCLVFPTRGALPQLGGYEVLVRGWSQQEAERFVQEVGGRVGSGEAVAHQEARVAPLYVMQALALGTPLREAQKSDPRLADLLGRRLDRLDGRARHLLQACCVMGRRVRLDALWSVVGEQDEAALETLLQERLLFREGEEVGPVHPFLGRLVEGGVPAAVRRDLHRRALRVATEENAPLEERAEHACRSGDGMAAILLLDGMGQAAVRRGLFSDAISAYRRALDIVRRAMYEQRPEGDESAFVRLSCKLGEAMQWAGDLSGADGVLREALEYVGPSDEQRGHLALLLGGVSRLRERFREAARWLQEAVAIGARFTEPHVVARAKLEMARLQRDEGDVLGAANAYRLAVEALDGAGMSADWRATGRLERARVLLDLGDMEEAERVLREGIEIAVRGGAQATASWCQGELGASFEMRGEREAAAESYALAASLAVASGDVEGHRRWHRAAEALGRAA